MQTLGLWAVTFRGRTGGTRKVALPWGSDFNTIAEAAREPQRQARTKQINRYARENYEEAELPSVIDIDRIEYLGPVSA